MNLYLFLDSPPIFPVSPTFFFKFAREGCNFATKKQRDEE